MTGWVEEVLAGIRTDKSTPYSEIVKRTIEKYPGTSEGEILDYLKVGVKRGTLEVEFMQTNSGWQNCYRRVESSQSMEKTVDTDDVVAGLSLGPYEPNHPHDEKTGSSLGTRLGKKSLKRRI